MAANRTLVILLLGQALRTDNPMTARNANRVDLVEHAYLAGVVRAHDCRVKDVRVVDTASFPDVMAIVEQLLDFILVHLGDGTLVPPRRPVSAFAQMLQALLKVLVVVHLDEVVIVEEATVVKLLELPAIQPVLVEHLSFNEFDEALLVDSWAGARDPWLRRPPDLCLVVVLKLLSHGPGLEEVNDSQVVDHGAII